MKKILSSLFVGTILLAGSTYVQAAEINGEESASVTVNGTLGQDNGDENGPNIDEGSKDWINIELDTANIFYTTKETNHNAITSPDYQITNKSGRGVRISTESFGMSKGNLENVEKLEIDGKDALGAEKKVDLKNFSPSEFIVLANNQGKLNIDSDTVGQHANKTTYKYIGTAKKDYYGKKVEKTAHTLSLTFEALGKDGKSVTKAP